MDGSGQKTRHDRPGGKQLSNTLESRLDIRSIIKQILPAQPCLLCGARVADAALCPGCRDDLPRLPAARCPRCARPTPLGETCGICLRRPPAFAAATAVFRYAYPFDILAQRLKYHGELAVARLLAEFLATALAGRDDRPDLLIPMPLHPLRLRERGFNQAQEIARHLARQLRLPLEPQALRRLRHTPAQVGQDLAARRRNIRGAFAADQALDGLRIALLDDVMTSGASLNELARTARRAGAQHVEVWILARTLRASDSRAA